MRLGLLEVFGDPGEPGSGAAVVRLAAWGAAHADAADGLVADLDRCPAAAGPDHVGKIAQAGARLRLGAAEELFAGLAERACGIGLAPRQLEVVRVGAIVAQ